MAKSIMIQGAGSNVGKSMIVAGLCRAFVRRGLKVLPFKPQNMSNNAAVTMDGGEIGRAQALQARACNVQPHTDMNPVLLKPETETGAQVVVQGKRVATLKARDYGKMKAQLMPKVLESFHRLCAHADLVLVEGAGSPAEVNLRKGDIANMGFARAADVPVILTGDIDRGGVLAQLVGTHVLLDAEDNALIKGFLINKFRGDPTLFDEGLQIAVDHTGWHGLGVLPWFKDAGKLPAEDAADIDSGGEGAFKIAVPKLSRIANFDDLDPLKLEPGVSVVIVEPGQRLPRDADLVLIPGSKSTIGDLAFLREQGWDADLMSHVERGKQVLGICGGYQMLGRTIMDPDGIEGPAGQVQGLGLLNVSTLMTQHKRLASVVGSDIGSGSGVSGYEIHIGETSGPDCGRPWLEIDGREEGATSADGLVRGCYVHGLFIADEFRRGYLATMGVTPGNLVYEDVVEQTLDALADHIEAHLDVEMIWMLAADIAEPD
ncbi:cobyric acid synthase [Neptunicoccus cionae]|uniref:cobyric acid synthase n=1 Tax=Neptunicoccus cionae TaxID=2035344 RepID=UPI000C772A04|nr:cobyric acid synthase [Amylibacter cionae]PLS23577.1 cobyric acid synthase CobQ [Amylibacter cionae]